MRTELRRAVFDRYAAAPAGTRWHVKGRLWSCPINPVLEALPRAGLVASLGCGHGAFEIAMALDAPGRRVIGADIDGRKLSFARRAAEGLPVEIHHGDLFEVLARAGEAPSAIAIIDVLYLIPPKCQEGLLSTAFSALNAGGILVIKEMDRRPAWKWWWNRFQEFLACRILRITRHQSGVVGLRPAEDWVQVLRSAGFIDVAARPIHRGFPHPHLLVSARKPTGGGAP